MNQHAKLTTAKASAHNNKQSNEPTNVDLQLKRMIDNISVDLNALSSESKKKYNHVKEASELCALKLRQINNLKSTNLHKSKPFCLFVCLDEMTRDAIDCQIFVF
jgi:hypothetical protein